jgi:XapX domain-containing protein
MKILLGFMLAFSIGAVCRFVGIPSPAPNAILGSLLVVSMSFGYVSMEQYLHRSKNTISHLNISSTAADARAEILAGAHLHEVPHQAATHRTIGS